MVTEVKVPTTGNAGEDAVVLEWNVAVGDAVDVDQVLCSLETAKAVVEVTAPTAGTLLEIRFPEGADAPEHAVLALLGTADEAVAGRGAPTAPTDTPAHEPAPVPTPERSGRTDESVPAPAGPARSARHDRIYASPRAKIIATQRGIDLATVTGSGPFGRITIRDVVAIEDRPASSAAGSVPAAETAPAATIAMPTSATPASAPSAPHASVVVPVRGARKVTAQRMQESLQQAAQVTLTRYADADALLRYAARLKEAAADGRPRITVNDLLLFAVARTVGRHPQLNSWFSWDGITQFSEVALGFAVDSGRALYVPVIPHADHLGLAELAAHAQDAIAKGRAGRLAPDDMAGGTFTVSNLGGSGIHWFTPVLNTPQSGILGIGTAHRGHPDAPALLPLSLTFDHRALDGSAAASALVDIARAIESVDILAAY